MSKNLELAERIAAARAHLSDCRLCPFYCGSARATGDGVCGVNQTSYIASEMLHMGEEEMLRPAHAIFFSGCTASCAFCIAARYAFQPQYGVAVAPAALADRIVQRQTEGARSICLIGGEPTPHIPFILATIDALGERKRVPIVVNSNFYMTPVALDLLLGAVDVYLPDLKFGPGDCGERIGGMPGYWDVVTQNIERVLRAGEKTLVRHLLMPGHLDCCTMPVLRWLAGKEGVLVSLLDQYAAPPNARTGLGDTLSLVECETALDTAERLGLRLVD